MTTESEQEARYDAERSGAAWVKPNETDSLTTILEEIDGGEAQDTFYGVSTSAGVESGTTGYIPILAIIDNVPTIRIGGCTDAELAHIMVTDPEPPTSMLPQRVHEVVRLDRRGLVVLDAEHEVFIMTAAEFAAQTGDDNKAGNEHAAELAKLPIEDRLFGALIDGFMNKVDAPCRAMAQAGLILLAAAADGIGPKLADDATEEEEDEEIQARIYHCAYTQGKDEGYTQGFDAGFSATLDLLRDKLLEQKAAREKAA